MNLKEIIRYIKRHTDYAPANEDYRDFLVDTINTARDRAYAEHDWTFMYRKAEVPLRSEWGPAQVMEDLIEAGLSPAGYPDSGEAEMVGGSRIVELRGPVVRLVTRRWDFIGQPLRIDGREYRIQMINVGAGGIGASVWVDQPLHRQAVTRDWSIIPRRVQLPPDAARVSAVTMRRIPLTDQRPINYNLEVVANIHSRQFDLDLLDGASDPCMFVIDPVEEIPAAGSLGIEVEDASPDTNFDGFYEFAWCYVGPGETFGPLSEPAIADLRERDGTTQKATLTPLEPDGTVAWWQTNANTSDPYPYPQEKPYHKALFVNVNFDPQTGARKGPPVWRQVPAGAQRQPGPSILGSNEENARPYYLSTTTTWSMLNSIFLAGTRDTRQWASRNGLIESGSIYPWLNRGVREPGFPIPGLPVQSATKLGAQERLIADLLYVAQPRRLDKDTDTPTCPPDFVPAIYFLALADVCMFANDEQKASMYRGWYEAHIGKMRGKYARTGTATWVAGPNRFGRAQDGIWTATVLDTIARNS